MLDRRTRTSYEVPKPSFRSRCMGEHLSDAPRDIATLTFDSYHNLNIISWNGGGGQYTALQFTTMTLICKFR